MTDFNGGLAQLQLGLSIRLAYGKNLPWMLAGMAHWDSSRALHWARQCVRASNSKPAAEHHRKSILFLCPGSILRTAIDVYISTTNMPNVLRMNIAVFLLIPLGDKPIESEHKPISDKIVVKSPVSAGHTFSVQRLKVIEKMMFQPSSPQWQLLLTHFMGMSTRKETIETMGLQHHPFFQGFFGQTRAMWRDWSKEMSGKVWVYLERIIYRQDLSLKFHKLDAGWVRGWTRPIAHRKTDRRAAMCPPVPRTFSWITPQCT